MDKVLKDALNTSTLQFMTHKLFMHYFDKNTKPNSSDPAWMNQGVFFWNLEEKFERKSLPPEFKNYSKYRFFIKSLPDSIKISKSQAIPWFGMEGNGDKYCFTKEENMVAISNIFSSGIINYFKTINVTNETINILQKREIYMFHFNPEDLDYQQGIFYRNNKPILIADAYHENLFSIIQLGPDKEYD